MQNTFRGATLRPKSSSNGWVVNVGLCGYIILKFLVIKLNALVAKENMVAVYVLNIFRLQLTD
jgi:hypothetical protein